MAYKNILSQMFDVRPRTAQGELDLEKIRKIRQVLDLAQKQKIFLKPAGSYELSRTINLREKIAQKIAVAKAVGRRKKQRQIFSDAQVLYSLLKEPSALFDYSQPEILETRPPEREDILATLEEIEQVNNYLKEFGLGLEELDEMDGAADENILEDMPAEENDSQDVELLELLNEGNTKDYFEEENKDEIDVFDSPPIFESPAVEPIADQQIVEPVVDEPIIEWSPMLIEQIAAKPKLGFKKSVAIFAGAGLLIWLVIFGLSIAGRGLSAKNNILSSGLQAYQAMLAGKDSASRLDFSAAKENFGTAYQNFWQSEQELNKMGKVVISVLDNLPGGSAVESGASLIDAGKDLARAGQSFSKIGEVLALENISQYFSGGSESLTQKISAARSELANLRASLTSASQNLNKVNVADLPAEMASSVGSLQKEMPAVASAVAEIDDWSGAFLGILGHERAKKYLLIFQNPAEARPTGGFIGTYGILDLDQGQLKNLFIDGIFNLDGQLYEKVVPPRPIQKISTAWSTHDANWFANFPTSAKKIMGFYESAGGTTPDGVISLTPGAIEKLLALTGPIDLPEFNVSLDQNNFTDIIQYKVESDYDKELNQPKKILAEFAPKFLDRAWEIWPQKYNEILQVLADSLAQKDILFYFSDATLEQKFKEQGWAGEILATDKDYLSVVNTNINGFKTDKVIEQKIYHTSDVQPDGSIVDTVKIIRKHNGGQSQYDWYNKVNTDYLRVYVPVGSKLLSAQGHTLESYSAPADYEKLNFKIDPDVQAQEQGMSSDENSGTQIFSESGKTVFGNWVYVSPGETAEVTYKYLLPFKLNLTSDNFSYSLLAQKQSGSSGGIFESILTLPQEFKINWQYPENLQISSARIKFNSDLKTDEFYGVVFEK